MVTTRRRPAPVESRPLTPAEQEAVERQGAYLAWVRTTQPGAEPRLFTGGVCGGSPHTGKDGGAMAFPMGSQHELDQAQRATTEREHRGRREAEEAEQAGRRAAQDKTT